MTKLSTEEAELFFRLMWGLQLYVNRQRQILPQVESVEEYAMAPATEKAPVRDALWKNPGLIDAYVRDNPDGLPAEELEIVRKWERFVAGTFQIFRLLKKHAIFIGSDAQVYGVLGLQDGLQDVVGARPLPVMVRAVLLPFKGKVVYDGLLEWYNIYFGGGIRSGLNEEYMTAKQNGRIITTLEPELGEPAEEAPKKPDRDWRAAVDELAEAAERLKGGSPVQRSAFALLRASARMAQVVVHDPSDWELVWQLDREVGKAWKKLQTALARVER